MRYLFERRLKSMIKKYIFGNPIQTDAVIIDIKEEMTEPQYIETTLLNGFTGHLTLEPDDIVYGLGEANRGINKRGYKYISNCSDDPNHTEDKYSFYGAHNFILIKGTTPFALFFDYPGKITFDIGFETQNEVIVNTDKADLTLYEITGTSLLNIVQQFREIIGMSYIPPRWAFGYQQSRWGYQNEADIREVYRKYHENSIPLDAIYLDIDYMEDYKDFTVDSKKFKNFPSFVKEMKDAGIHLVPIIDAGIKIEDGYDVYEEGVANNYFCKRVDGSNFVAGVWPGRTHFPDFMQKEVREWFGNKYSRLISDGIEGFWNDMNEPAIFYSEEGLTEAFKKIKEFEHANLGIDDFFAMKDVINSLSNNPKDYEAFYHMVDGKNIPHNEIHNLYGYYMTRAAMEAFDEIEPDKRLLLFSRSSYIGMHRYGGIWTGDNQSWWSHLLLNIKMMPSLSMCGFLYTGADIGGFGSNTTRDLLLRWLAFGVFTPLMRNHAALGTRNQECYQFENIKEFADIIRIRYRLLPYIYSEYVNAARNNLMLFRPLSFDFEEDSFASSIEDQLMFGSALMLTPVYTQNAKGRYVYLPEAMLFVKFIEDNEITFKLLEKGHHYIEVALTEVPLFIRHNQLLPICESAERSSQLDVSTITLLGHLTTSSTYTLYEDDGYTKEYEKNEHFTTIQVEKDEQGCYQVNCSKKEKKILLQLT